MIIKVFIWKKKMYINLIYVYIYITYTCTVWKKETERMKNIWLLSEGLRNNINSKCTINLLINN